MAYLGYGYGLAGERGKALAILHRLEERSRRGFVSAYQRAVIYVGLGDTDHALQWLERGIEDKSEDMVGLKVDPAFDSLRSDPRFFVLLRRMGFTN